MTAEGRLWAFTRRGLGARIDAGRLGWLSPQPLVRAAPRAAVYHDGVVCVASEAGVQVFDADLGPLRHEDLGCPVLGLAVLPDGCGIAVAHLEGGAILADPRRGVWRRHDVWDTSDSATAAAPADQLTGRRDAVVWGTSEGRLAVRYDDDATADPGRLTSLCSPGRAAIWAVAQAADGCLYCATAEGEVWRYDRAGGAESIGDKRLDLFSLASAGDDVIGCTTGGKIVRVSGNGFVTMADLKVEARAMTRLAGEVYVALQDGRVASASGLEIQIAQEPIYALC